MSWEVNLKLSLCVSVHPQHKLTVDFSMSFLNMPILFSIQLHYFLQNSQFYNNSIGVLYLDANGELVANLDIVNWVISSNKSVSRVKCGSLEREGSFDFKFMINQKAIERLEVLNKVGKTCHFTLSKALTMRIAVFSKMGFRYHLSFPREAISSLIRCAGVYKQ